MSYGRESTVKQTHIRQNNRNVTTDLREYGYWAATETIPLFALLS